MSSRQVECVKTAHMDLNVMRVGKIVHVDLETVETERKIVHVHEDLKVKSTVRV